MENTVITFESICRVCLSHEKLDKMVSLIDPSQETGLSFYGSSFEEITKIPVNQNKYLPVKLCEKCRLSLEGVSKFIVDCEVSDRKLRKLIKFSLTQDLQGPLVKEVVCQFSLFSQNFQQSSRINGGQTCNSQFKKDVDTFISQQVNRNDCKYPKVKVEVLAVHSSSYEYESMSENAKKYTKNVSDVDIFIYSIEKLISSPTLINDLKPDTKSSIQNHKESKSMGQQDINLKPKKKVKAEQSFMCSICQKVLTTEKTYKHHIQRHGACRFVCDQCGKGFPINAELVQHQIHNHGARSQYECDVCSYRAVKKIQLIEHIRLHTGERPFTCEKCGLTFRRKTLYNKHAKFHGEKTIPCDLCPRKFFIRSSMLAHRNRHNREFVYLCRICNVTYALSRTVRKHMLDKHGIPKHMQGKIQKCYKASVTECSSFQTSKSEELNYL